jgi:hypothetical protein
MSNTVRGLLSLIPIVVVNAATDVYGGNRTQSISPVTLAAVLGPLLRRGSTVLVAAGILVLIGVLSWGSFAGRQP